MSEYASRWRCAAGVFLSLLGLYLLTAPGRIDVLDGQWRYEVAKNWLDRGEPLVSDPWLLAIPSRLVNPRTGKAYAGYNAAPSITPMPLMAFSRLLPGHNSESDRFAFSLAGPLFGAALGAILFLAYGMLGIRLRTSLLYTAIFCLATLWWPASVTIFDQNQHAVFLLGAILLAWQSGRRGSLALAGLAGLLGGLVLNYQEMYALLLPIAGLAVLAAPEEGSAEACATLGKSPGQAGLRRYLTFGGCCGVGLGLFIAYNEMRFGTWLAVERYATASAELARHLPPTWGSPLAGFLGLATSPGKGFLWFSPPLALAILGARGLWRRAPALALAAAGVSIVHLLVITRLTFFGGDWCWGPRYLIPIMPLWALAFPFAAERVRHPRRLIASVSGIGLLVQMLGISLDYQRFFWERDLPACFWVAAPWYYFEHSQLLARPVEIASTLRSGLPREAVYFSPAPGEATYAPLGTGDPLHADRGIRQFQIFYLPRPWWGWIGHVRPMNRPIEPRWLAAWCAALLLAGSAFLRRSLRAAAHTDGLKRAAERAIHE